MKFKLFFTLILVAVVAAACGGGSSGASPFPSGPGQPNEIPTAPSAPINVTTPIPTLEVQPTQGPTSNCPEYYTEEFDTPNECFDLNKVFFKAPIVPPPEAARIYLAGGALNFEFPLDKSTFKYDLYYYFFNGQHTYNDVALETTFQTLTDSNLNTGFILACRVTDQSWFEARVTTNGSYWLYQYDRQLEAANKNPYIEITKGQTNKIAAKRNVPNTMRLECVGDTLSLIINGNKITTNQIRRPLPGGVGVGFTTFPERYPAFALIESVTIAKP